MGLAEKEIKKGNSWTTEGLSSFQSEEGESILKLAEDKGDEALALQVRGISLFSKKKPDTMQHVAENTVIPQSGKAKMRQQRSSQGSVKRLTILVLKGFVNSWMKKY